MRALLYYLGFVIFLSSSIASTLGAVQEPDPVKNNSTLQGIDVDANGVRDDVQIWIDKTFQSDPEIIKSLNNYAIKIQESYTHKDNKIESNKSVHRKLRAQMCAMETMESKKISRPQVREHLGYLRAMYENTKMRIEAKLKTDKNYHGESDVLWSKEEACK